MNALNRMDRRGFQNLNNGLITLIPKQAEAKVGADFRPIFLIHFAKIFAKMLARRLTPVIGDHVDSNRSTFIQSRSIHDNFKLVQAMAKLFKSRACRVCS